MERTGYASVGSWRRGEGVRLLACLATLAGALVALGVVAEPSVGDDVPNAQPAQGGLFRDLEAAGKERHHLIATQVLEDAGYSVRCGPAIRMDTPDHKDTPSWGTAGQSYRDQQAAILADQSLSEDQRFRKIIQLDIDNIRRLFGSKYDSAIAEMLERYDRLRELLDERGADWKSLASAASCNPPPAGGAAATERQPSVSPAAQHVMANTGTRVNTAAVAWTVTVLRDPARSQTLMVDFDDGSTAGYIVASGAGTATVRVSHAYYTGVGAFGSVTTDVVMEAAPAFAVAGGQPATAQVTFC